MKRLVYCAVLICGIARPDAALAEDIRIRIVNTTPEDHSVFIFQKPPANVPESSLAWMVVPRANNTIQVFEPTLFGPKPLCVATVENGDTVYTTPQGPAAPRYLWGMELPSGLALGGGTVPPCVTD